MPEYETTSKTDEWYTPPWIFEALAVRFNLDVSAPVDWERTTHVPADGALWKGGLDLPWNGFVWMNPPYGKRNGVAPWIAKFAEHGNGVGICRSQTCASWFHDHMPKMDALLFLRGRVKYIDRNGNEGKSPGFGSVMFACGEFGVRALRRMADRGMFFLQAEDA